MSLGLLTRRHIFYIKRYLLQSGSPWSAGTDTITVKAFLWNGGALGNEVPLSTIGAWSDIEPGPIEVKNLSAPLFTYMRTPFKNYIDGSPVGVSIFASALPILEEMDNTWNDAAWEREAGRAKAFVDETMIPQKIIDGKITVPTALGDDAMSEDDIKALIDSAKVG